MVVPVAPQCSAIVPSTSRLHGESSRQQSFRRQIEAVAITLVLGAHLALALGSSLFHSATFDEPAHLTAGISYWLFDDYRLQPECGNLSQCWPAVFVLFLGQVHFPSRDQPAWSQADVGTVSYDLMYRSHNDPHRLLLIGRASISLISAVLCLTIFFWSRTVWGPSGAWISLLAAAFCPNLIAHGHLMTSDLLATFFFTASAWQIWRNLEQVTRGRTLLGAALVSGLFLCKYSAPLIIPMAVLMVIVRLAARSPILLNLGIGKQRLVSTLAAQIVLVLAIAIIYAVVCWILIWTAYGWRYSVVRSANHEVGLYGAGSVRDTAKSLGSSGKLIQALAEHHLLPEAYLYGTAYTAAHMTRSAFWNGQYSETGWRGFFPYCWLVKTPLPTIGLLALAAAALLSRARPGAWQPMHPLLSSGLVPAVALLVVYWPAAIFSTLNIGLRHVLPTYPAMFVLIGAVSLLDRVRLVRWLCRALVCWLVLDCSACFPNYIAYFNSWIGINNGYRHLVDSNLDWGQDLPQLKSWLDAAQRGNRSAKPMFLAYFGRADPVAHGIRATKLFSARSLVRYEPGMYCISATHLQRVNGTLRRMHIDEPVHRAVRKLLRKEAALPGEPFLPTAAADDPVLPHDIPTMNLLQAGRLMAYLQHRQPLANVGGSILIYDLSATDLEEALKDPLQQK